VDTLTAQVEALTQRIDEVIAPFAPWSQGIIATPRP